MNPSTLGLKSTIKSITAKDLIWQLCDFYAPKLAHSKEMSAEDLINKLINHRKEDKTETDNLVCAIIEIGEVCASRNASVRVVDALRKVGELEKFKQEVSGEYRTLQNMSTWTLLNAHDAWVRILLKSRSECLLSHTWDEYKIKDKYILPKHNVQKLEDAFSGYLAKEVLHGEYVHVELDEEPYFDRYIVSVNNFPHNVQQFDKRGNYELRRDSNALNFIIEYHRTKETVRIRCNFDSERRKGLVKLFAQIVLNTDIKENSHTKIDLSRHLKSAILPKIAGKDIISVRRTGLSISFSNREGSIDTCTLTTEGPSNIKERMLACLTIFGIPDTSVEVSEVRYTFNVKSKIDGIKTVNASLRQDGIHIICRDSYIKNLIKDYMSKVATDEQSN